MTDLLTRLELEDAIKHYDRIAARVAEVALVWANITSEIDSGEERKWHLERFFLYRAGGSDEMMVDARMILPYEDRPVTKTFGDPGDDGESDYNMTSYIGRRITFPMEWLMTEDWHALAEKRAWEINKLRRDLKITNLTEALRIKALEAKRLEGELEKAKQVKV